ncbi:MAG TPA: hypothetical protein VG944_16495 [Fimbriimonas sp.]|nr:hypothetical protein [Fimbriimonas sp.]
MTQSQSILIAEFEAEQVAKEAALALRPIVIDMGGVRVHGRRWLDRADPEGGRTIGQAALLGAKIGFVFALLPAAGLAFTFLPTSAIALPHVLSAFGALVFFLLIGVIAGTCLGVVVGLIAESADTPEWVKEEFGNHLKEGGSLLVIKRDADLTDHAAEVIDEFHPYSIRIRSASHRQGEVHAPTAFAGSARS